MSQVMGILGAGQLASMLAKSAVGRGIDVAIYSSSIHGPACSLASNVMLGEPDDFVSLSKFFKFCDFIVLESEFFKAETLERLVDNTGTKVYPEVIPYKKLSTKISQKEFFKNCDIPMAQTNLIKSMGDILKLKLPLMLKQSSGGYDGYGNLLITEVDLSLIHI